MLHKVKFWFGDGDFSSCPSSFGQIYTIHVLYEKTCIPLVYCLLVRETEDAYKRVFQKFIDLHSGLSPDHLMIDFEVAVKNAAESVFENIQIHYCFFHFRQSLYRKIGNLGLKERYNTDENFNLKIKMFAALAFVPPADVISLYENIVEEHFPDMDQPVQKFLLYFGKYYIGSVIGNRRRIPRFSIEMWNQFDQTLSEMPRTNNSVGGWHRGFEFLFSKKNSTIWDVLRAFQRDETISRKVIQDLRSGVNPEPPRKKYKSYSARILRIVQNYGSNLYENDNFQYIPDVSNLLTL